MNDLTQFAIDYLMLEGACAAGVATTETLAGGPPSTDLEYVLPGAKSAVSFAVPLDPVRIERFLSKQDQAGHQEDNIHTNFFVTGLAVGLATYLDQRGYPSYGVAANTVYRKDTPRGLIDFMPDLSHRYLAVRSGVGWFGLSGNVITKTHGAAVILGTVVTTADLEPTDPLPVEENYCDECRLCMSSCLSGLMGKKDLTTVTMGGMEFSYAKRRSYHRCDLVCGGFTGLAKNGKWSTWSPGRFPIPEKDEEFQPALLKAITDSWPRPEVQGGFYHPAMPGQRKINFTCGNCQLLCHPDRAERKRRYRLLTKSGVVVQHPDGSLEAVPPDVAERHLAAMSAEQRAWYKIPDAAPVTRANGPDHGAVAPVSLSASASSTSGAQSAGDSVYLSIAENVDAGPMMAPKANGGFSPAFIQFLALLYTPAEAEIVRHLRMPPAIAPSPEDLAESVRSVDDIARAAGKSAAEVAEVLDPLVRKGSVIGLAGNYALPVIALLVNQGQFSERVDPHDVEAGRLYQQFFVKEGFYKYYESSEMGTQVMRVIPVQRTLQSGQRILDTEEAHEIIDAAGNLSLVPCPCRVRTEKLGIRECRHDTPIGACIMMETSALYFQSTGVGRQVTAEEAKKYFDQMQDLGLVGTTENHEDAGHNVICLCCKCCCSQLRGRTRWDNPDAVAPSNFVAESTDDCLMCGKCEDRCVFGAIMLDEGLSRSVVDAEKCMGCGVCTITCDQEALRLKRVEREQPLPTARELAMTIAAENREGRGRSKAAQV